LKKYPVALVRFHSVRDTIRGTLCVAEYDKQIPFEPKRIFYIYDLPLGGVRGEHAHRNQKQLFVCLRGRVDIITQISAEKCHFTLSRPDEGLYLPPMTWMSFKVMEQDTLCLVISSGIYDEDDYIRGYDAFLTESNCAL
jgi:UDP-2-acetamido-3-amino-2,3-dideoxy-glucuronate N-acetyltransferase